MYPFRVAIGFLVVFLSVILFLTTARFVPWGIWLFVWQFWPMLLVIFGIAFLIRRWKLNFLLGSSIFALIFALTGAGLWVTWKSQYFNTDQFAERNGTNVTTTMLSNELPKKIDHSDVRIIFGSSKIQLGAIDNSGSNLLYSGTHKSNFFTMNESLEMVGDKAKLTLKTSPWIKKPFASKGVNELNMDFSEKIPYSFDITTQTSDVDLNFQNLKVPKLDIDAGASNINVRFGASSSIDAKINAGASAIRLYVPKDLGIIVHSHSTLMSNNFQKFGLSKKDANFESPNLKNEKNKLNIDLSSGISRVELLPE